jgi:hypothetical protein
VFWNVLQRRYSVVIVVVVRTRKACRSLESVRLNESAGSSPLTTVRMSSCIASPFVPYLFHG